MTDHPSMTLARNVAAMRFADFPAATIHKAKIHILDTLGAAIAGITSLEAQTVLQAFGLVHGGGTGPASVWGTTMMLDSRTASFVNGVSAHAFELDDSGGCDHSGAVVMPAVIAALGEVRGTVTGQDFLTAVLAGYEVGRRMLEASGGYETHNELGWHSTGTCGAFAAAAAASVLFGLDADRHASALGVASSYAGGTWAFIHDGSQTKKLHAGRAAEGGFVAAKLAASGFDGPLSVLDAAGWGNFFTTFCRGEARPDLLNADFGQFWRVNRCSIKPYATCRGTHSAIDAIDKILTERGIAPQDIARIDVAMSEFQAGMCGGKIISSRADAQMSLAYAVAARLQYGKVGLDELEREAWSAPAIEQWLALTNVGIDTAMAANTEPAIAVTLHDGRMFSETVEFPLGGMANPMSDAAVIAKFETLAGRVLPGERCRALCDFVMNLDMAPDARHLPVLLALPAKS
ncbi:MmgE/PrpD family protein [Brucella anthropi]|uniref:MmgE/PrpD family protein n=1 Tax=Brucella anthropi TaxID=529 RepID=UPI0004A6F346|nr:MULTISPECIES: MmgE/PrpD family protein [Brucella/Ochrobactrum group]NIH75414.1 2-methylcitrate dehydratase PrpD [Ochrobactrum sp. P20RRXII]